MDGKNGHKTFNFQCALISVQLPEMLVAGLVKRSQAQSHISRLVRSVVDMQISRAFSPIGVDIIQLDGDKMIQVRWRVTVMLESENGIILRTSKAGVELYRRLKHNRLTTIYTHMYSVIIH